jgi:lysozyme
MNLGQKGLDLIKEYEGFRSAPYRDPVGVWTIGYGSTKGVGPNTPRMTEQQASDRLRREVDQTYGAAVNKIPGLNQNQFDAITSFVYNVGTGGIGDTGVGRALRAKDWNRAANELLKWDKAGGRTLAGLTRRRQAERKLFLTPVGPPVVPVPPAATEAGEHTGMSWLFPQTAPAPFPG